jgi:hypothetical protein
MEVLKVGMITGARVLVLAVEFISKRKLMKAPIKDLRRSTKVIDLMVGSLSVAFYIREKTLVVECYAL